ncbi:MAG: alpha-2-macroglobulin family protein, partial [Phycisphaeraceae bacterium]|nr:alpha-2-macroglobulin family protein [Phycisphaeraceae bacterium]
AGRLETRIPIPEKLEPGLWRLSAHVAVTETGGRTVAQNASSLVDTTGRHVGLKVAGGRGWIARNRPVNVAWVLADGTGGQAVAGPIDLKLRRIDHRWVYEQINGRHRWHARPKVTTLRTWSINTGAGSEGTFPLQINRHGHHELVAVDRKSGSRTVVDFYVRWNGNDYGHRLEDPTRLTLQLDRKQYAPGSKAKCLIKSPFTGLLLLTVESETIVHRQVVEMKTNSFELTVPVDPSIRSNGYISATVVRPVDRDQDQWLPHRAYGMVRLNVDRSAHRMALRIEAPAKTRPGRTVRVTVHRPLETSASDPKSEPTGRVHLWAVDEGVLLSSRYTTPDPHQTFFARRRSAVLTADAYASLLPDHKRPISVASIGAGDDGGKGGPQRLRRSPVAIKARQSVVLFARSIPFDAEGRASVTWTVPKMTGRLRLMAVAADGDRYGSARRPLIVNEPVLVQSSWPRFAAPQDVFRVPVKLFNTTGSTADLRLSAEVDGPLKLSHPPAQPLVLGTEAKTLWLEAEALSAGQAKIHFKAEGLLLNPPAGESQNILVEQTVDLT